MQFAKPPMKLILTVLRIALQFAVMAFARVKIASPVLRIVAFVVVMVFVITEM